MIRPITADQHSMGTNVVVVVGSHRTVGAVCPIPVSQHSSLASAARSCRQHWARCAGSGSQRGHAHVGSSSLALQFPSVTASKGSPLPL